VCISTLIVGTISNPIGRLYPKCVVHAMNLSIVSQEENTQWEDGSVKDSIGWHVSTILDNDEVNVEGSTITAGNPVTLVCLRSKHCGTLAILSFFIKAICNYHKITETGGKLTVWMIDNVEVVN